MSVLDVVWTYLRPPSAGARESRTASRRSPVSRTCMNEFVDAAWSMMVTVDDFAEVVLSGVPRKSEPHRLLLPPPQTQRRPHGTGLEPAGPTARPSGEAETAVVAWTPRGKNVGAAGYFTATNSSVCR